MPPVMAYSTKFGLGLTGSAVNEFYEARAVGIRKSETHVESEGARGTRSRLSENVVEGTYTVGGPVTLVPTPTCFDTLLPKILGADEATNVFALAETLPDFISMWDLVTKVPAADGCKVNTARFYSSRGQPLLLDLDIQGKRFGAYASTTFTEGDPGAASSFPSQTLSILQPYMHHQLVLTIGGTVYKCDNFEIMVNNALILDRFLNSQTRTALPESDRIITVSADFPYTTDEDELFNIATAGLAATAVYTNGDYSISFSFAKLQAPAESPIWSGRSSEVTNRIVFQARTNSTTKELVVTNDSTGS